MTNEGTTTPEQKKKITLYCSFCGKSQHEVKKLVKGPGVNMCDECVQLAVEQIFESDITIRVPSGNDVLDLSKKLDAAVSSVQDAKESFRKTMESATTNIVEARRKLGDMIQFREEISILRPNEKK